MTSQMTYGGAVTWRKIFVLDWTLETGASLRKRVRGYWMVYKESFRTVTLIPQQLTHLKWKRGWCRVWRREEGGGNLVTRARNYNILKQLKPNQMKALNYRILLLRAHCLFKLAGHIAYSIFAVKALKNWEKPRHVMEWKHAILWKRGRPVLEFACAQGDLKFCVNRHIINCHVDYDII